MVGRALASSRATMPVARPQPPKRNFPGVINRSVTRKRQVVSLTLFIPKNSLTSTMPEVTGRRALYLAFTTDTTFANGQTCTGIDPRFIYLALLLAAVGAYGYVRGTLRGVTSRIRVTWSVWGLEGVLGFGVEIQQHVGLASLMTLMLGLGPCVVVLASFRNSHSVWKIGAFDVVCGVISLSGLALWAIVQQPALALISFVAADQVAALPT